MLSASHPAGAYDGIQNGDEQGVDCGGDQCEPCKKILIRGDKRYESSNHLADYHFGFNGKEADTDGEWGGLTQYDYGFRGLDHQQGLLQKIFMFLTLTEYLLS